MKPIQLKTINFFICFLAVAFFGQAQNCTLDIGGKNHTVIVDVFQLNSGQQAVMEVLRGELEIAQKEIEDEIQKLFETHPQSTETELITLADKYKILKEKMVSASWESDKKLLETFNQKQYERYLSLCYEALRDPIVVTPVSYEANLTPE